MNLDFLTTNYMKRNPIMKNNFLSLFILLFALIAVDMAQVPQHKIKKPGQTTDISPCSNESIQYFLTHMPEIKPGIASTKDDSEGVSDVRALCVSNFCLSCATVVPFDTMVRKLLLQFLRNDKYADVRAEAAADFNLFANSIETDHYRQDTEIVAALTTAMRQDNSAVVRLEAAHTLNSFCHRDTLEVLDTLISIAMRIPEQSSPENKKPCSKCPSIASKLRIGAIKSMIAKEFIGNERVIGVLKSLSNDNDNFIKKEANIGLRRNISRQNQGGQ